MPALTRPLPNPADCLCIEAVGLSPPRGAGRSSRRPAQCRMQP
ncbi:hypothetical protein PCLA_02r0644 [Pseudomonas citronellolis]|nr:hypothetical protein PCLA_02r0644 [Pseudomonas citronellolis]